MPVRDTTLVAFDIAHLLPFHPPDAVANTLALSLTGGCAIANGTPFTFGIVLHDRKWLWLVLMRDHS